jgi:hypothetical protein
VISAIWRENLKLSVDDKGRLAFAFTGCVTLNQTSFTPRSNEWLNKTATHNKEEKEAGI